MLKHANPVSRIHFSEILRSGVSHVLFLIILFGVLSVFAQTFEKTPFLPGGRGSIEYLHAAGFSGEFGSCFSYTFFSLLARALNVFMGNMMIAAKVSVLMVCIVYFVSLYMLSSVFSLKWCALMAPLTAFVPFFSDTLLKGDYGLLTALAFTTLFLNGVCAFIQRPSRVRLALSAAALALMPYADPHLLPWLSIPVILTIVLCALFLGKKFTPHLVSLATIYVAMSTLSMTVFCGFSDGLWRPNPLNQLAMNVVISAFLLFSSIIGMLSLYRRRQLKLMSVIVLWLFASALCAIFEPLSLSFALPVLSALAIVPLWHVKGAFVVRRIEGGGEFQYEVEVDLGRLAALLLVTVLVALLILAVQSTIVLGDHEITPPLRVEDIYGASSFLSQENGQRFIVAHPSLANWLLVHSGLKVLPVLNDETFRAADLITTTSFRLMNPFLKVDDWEPFSAAKAPLVHVYDGRGFRQLVYIDDSYARVILEDSDGRSFIESPFRAEFLSYAWKETLKNISLIMSFHTPGLIINKTITLAKTEPTLSVEYFANIAREGVSIKGFTLNVYSLPMEILPELQASGREAVMNIDRWKTLMKFEGNLTAVSEGRTKDQRFVTCIFNPLNSSSVYGAVKIHVETSVASHEKPWCSSFYEEVKRYGVDYVIIPEEHRVFMEGALPYWMESLIIKDSFVRFCISSYGSVYQEAPAYAKVLNETIYEDARLALYKTAGLLIEKQVNFKENGLDLLYKVQPHKDETQLLSATLSVWIDYARRVKFQNVSEQKTLSLALDSGNFTLTFKGNLSNVVLERHPEYGQLRIFAEFHLKPSADEIGVEITSDRRITPRYVPTTRPEMRDNDEVTLSAEGGVFKPVKELKLYTIYRLEAP